MTIKPTLRSNMRSNIFKYTLFSISAGVWVIVLQNFGILPHKTDIKNTVSISGDVDLDEPIEIKGQVSVKNTVDVNLAEINGHSDAFFNNVSAGDYNKYYRIPVIAH